MEVVNTLQLTASGQVAQIDSPAMANGWALALGLALVTGTGNSQSKAGFCPVLNIIAFYSNSYV